MSAQGRHPGRRCDALARPARVGGRRDGFSGTDDAVQEQQVRVFAEINLTSLKRDVLVDDEKLVTVDRAVDQDAWRARR